MPVPTDPTPNFVPGTLADADLVDARFKKLYDTLDPAVSGVDESNVRTGGLWTASASLPLGPRDGQECYVLADAANSVIWHMRYRAAVGRWEFVGGKPMIARVDTSELVALGLATWGNIATQGPLVTLPLAGDYDVEFGATLTVGANGQTVRAGIALGDTTPTGNQIDTVAATAQIKGSYQQWERFTGRSAGDILKMRYFVATVAGGSPAAQYRWLKVTPWRL